MLADHVKRTAEVGQPQFGSARRKRDVIRSSLKCLALYHPAPRKLLAKLVADMFDRYRRAGQAPLTIRDLNDDVQIYTNKKTQQPYEGPSQLERLMRRLAQIVNDARNENVLVPAWARLQGTVPLTIHEMKLTAGVRCDCAICERLRAGGRAPLVPPLPVEEDWSDFEPEIETAGSESADEPDPF
jgi:hypothetical protein